MKLTTLADGWRYLESHLSRDRHHLLAGREYRLDRMRLLTRALGDPQNHYTIFHIAGSKGKGSTATLLAGALSAGGDVTGLFTSPHLYSYSERIQVFNFPLEDTLILEELTEIQRLLRHPPSTAEHPTFFELITLLALRVFRRCRCRFVVLEVGLGGRLDATNIVVPAASLITPIELEHSAILGTDLTSIAGEKAGIIKEGVPVFSARQPSEVREVLQRTARERNAPIFFLEDLLDSGESQLVYRQHGALRIPVKQHFRLRWRDGTVQQGELALLGHVQLANAALVLALLKQLAVGQASNWFQGLALAYPRARCQFLPLGSSVLCLDGAHTSQSISATLSTFLPVSEGSRRSLIFATLPDKDCRAMARQLAPHFSHIIVSQLSSDFKQADCQHIATIFAEFGRSVVLTSNPREALDLIGPARYALVCGSFYLVGEILKLVTTLAHADS